MNSILTRALRRVQYCRAKMQRWKSATPYSSREEVANSISHGLGLLLALVAVPVLVLSAMRAGNIRFLVGVSVFGGTMVLLYLASTLYHSITHETAKQFFVSSITPRSFY